MNYPEDFINKIICGDCLDVMKDIPDGVVDLVIADPPYGISRESSFHTKKDRKNPRTGTDLAEWDVNFDISGWLGCVVPELRDGGSLLAFNAFTNATIVYDGAVELGLVYKDTLVWHKTNPMPRNRDRRYMQDTEMIQWYVKKGVWVFNRQNDKYESRILSYPSESGGGFKRYHPTQKPLKLLEYLVRIHSNEGDTILDPFVGSGTTPVVCKRLGRNFIGIDISEEYCEIAKERLELE